MLVCVLAVAAAVGVVAIAAFLFRRLGQGTEDGAPDGPTAGHAGSMLSSLFLLVFAIAIVVPWTTADAARQNTYAESRAAVDAYWAAARLPVPVGAQVQQQIRDYVQFVLHKEWPLMAEGRLSLEGDSRVDALRAQVSGLVVTGDQAVAAKAETLEEMKGLSAARRQRGADAQAEPPAGVLPLTILTGVIVLLFPFMAGARPRGRTLVPLFVMAALLGVGVFLTWQISRVFDSGLSVGPEAFRAALSEFQRIPWSG
ncbi:hypothetical protein Sme01_10800 [Sphaerisporangium melleum]|uniref:DUF4239 domain-containing protein n=1 Tax=Sphaerisporangium melleum TaxID=321316 RepID=A0A917QSZ5_9ACTN|nr:DUF4239 domain-containing protein [Sphaerisporangium melleum]GGK66449.1 hypothetical protein GCM10007964_06820 [Sphaerisporangium melleum]GII68604.1 hypothetical protein Sme01_10800 [Sphaerisporangium melleum]